MSNDAAKPFLKWAGGKSQLVSQISDRLPVEFGKGSIRRYLEPFVGGGAVFFRLMSSLDFEQVVLIDINPALISAYKTLQRDVDSVIGELSKLTTEYKMISPAAQAELYYKIRHLYNQGLSTDIVHTAQLIFLNKTCFNGLYRVNRQGEFNVPMGRYKHPRICDSDNLKAVAKALANVVLLQGDYRLCLQYVDTSSFVYLDPPYRPIKPTSNFTSYSSTRFDDEAQQGLATFCRDIDRKGGKFMLSNSDPRNERDDDFFDLLYDGFKVDRVKASRMINSKASQRGQIAELLITNY